MKYIKIRELKARYGLTNIGLAKVIGRTDTSVSYKLSGKSTFDSVEMGRLVNYFRELEANRILQDNGSKNVDSSTLEQIKNEISFETLFFDA